MRSTNNIYNYHIIRGVQTFLSPRTYPLSEKKAYFILPLLLFIILQIIYRAFVPELEIVKNAAVERERALLKSQFEVLIRENKISEYQAGEQIEAALKGGGQFGGGMIVWLAGEFLTKTAFLVMMLAMIYFTILKRITKNKISFNNLLAEYGTAYYIFASETVLMFIAAFMTGRMMLGINAAEIFGADRIAFEGFLLSRLNPFMLFFYWHLGCRFYSAAQLKSPFSGFLIAGGLSLSLNLILYLLLSGTSLITLLY